jgi:hypothetical protein
MQNPEEDILKRFLQDTFSDYEPEPDEQTWEHIRTAIQPHKPSVGSKIKQWILPSLALLFFVGGLIYVLNQEKESPLEIAMKMENPNAEIVLKTEGSAVVGVSAHAVVGVPAHAVVGVPAYAVVGVPTDHFEKSNSEVGTNSIRPSVSEIRTNSIPPSDSEVGTNNIHSSESKISEVRTNNIRLSNSEIETNSIRPSDSEIGMNNIRPQITKTLLVNMTTSNEEREALPLVIKPSEVQTVGKVSTDDFLVSTQKRPLSNFPKVLNFREVEIISSAVVDVPTDNFGGDKKELVEIPNTAKNESSHQPINNAIITEVRYVKPLETLKNKDFVVSKPQFELPQINHISITKDPKPLRRPTYLSLSIMPLQTYRILTVNRREVQNLQTNNLFDSERNGWAFDLGMTKSIGNSWNFRGGLTYLKMRQWAEYQINTENISVKNSSNYSNVTSVANNENEYIGQTQIEAKTLQMFGLRADVQKFLKVSGRNRYFISAGSQVLYESQEKQTNVFINASAGFQHVVSQDCFLTIEPTASYLLNNINDSKSLIQTNAYNLGLKIGVNFKLK